ncbi:MAG TPA: hypothetical protein PL185_13610 [Flavobacteriales bacterium]|nr:hypothetical protein [Flavobacteriales bacterium]
MKRLVLLIAIGSISLFTTSCKKCYTCTCTEVSTYGCSQLGESIELCDKGFVGKSILSARVIEKESEGYTCTLE